MRHAHVALPTLALLALTSTYACFDAAHDTAPPPTDGGLSFDAADGAVGVPDSATDGGVDSAPDSGDASAPDAPLTSIDRWTWMTGSNATGATANYGVLGAPDVANTPGSRYGATSWSDAAGHLVLFGGTPATGVAMLNDLWKFDGTSWTWFAGSNTNNAVGVYGTPGVAAAGNIPGARYFTASAKDAAGNIWLFGGKGFGATATEGYLSDLWKYDGANWTWVTGPTTVGTAASYGVKGTAAGTNTPGGRARAHGWIDGAGHFWLFGGRDTGGNNLADLWKWDGTNWTFMSGSSAPNAAGVYGTMGTADAANYPGAREVGVNWLEGASTLWLYSGYGYDSAGTKNDLGDVWKFDGASWTWVSGSKIVDSAPVFGTRRTPAASNDPGARENAVALRASNGVVWMMGGAHGNGPSHDLGDLWAFDGTTWTRIAGANVVDALGVYGMRGTSAMANVLGGRDSHSAWLDANGAFWVFGGWGFGQSGTDNDLNDLWRYQP